MLTLHFGKRSESDGQATAPAHGVPGGLPSEALLADILVNKYADHPREGVTIDRARLAGWVGRAAGYLTPIVNRQKADFLESDRLFVDETTAKMLAPSSGKAKTGYLWAMARGYGELLDDLLPGNGVDTKATKITFETNVIATTS